MHRTYELYFRKEHAVEFRPLTSPPGEIIGRARVLLREHEADEVEVREAGQTLFILTP